MAARAVAGRTGKTLLLSDDVFLALSNRSDMQALFPFLRLQIGPVSATCRCNRAAAQRHAQLTAIQAAKNSLIALPAERLAAFKKALGADRIEFYTRSGKKVL